MLKTEVKETAPKRQDMTVSRVPKMGRRGERGEGMFGGGDDFLFPSQVKWISLSRVFFGGGEAYQMELNLPFQ